jgi:TolB protein
MNADGSGGQTRLTRMIDTGAYASSPSWSPDGGKIAFESDRDGSDSEIYVMNADGSDVTQLTNNNASDGSPSWSPDGERIAFVSDRAFKTPRDSTGTMKSTLWMLMMELLLLHDLSR